MSREKMVRHRNANMGTKKYRESAKRIKALRESLGDLQNQFAKRLDVTQAMVSAWEGAKDGLSSAFSVRLGNLASFPDNLWFWERAGLDRQAMVSATEKLLKERGKPPQVGEIVRIPCIQKTARGSEDTGRLIPLPGEVVPNPGSTSCFVIPERHFEQPNQVPDFVIVDTSWKDSRDPRRFLGQIVLIEFASRDQRESVRPWFWPEGLFVGLLLEGEEKDREGITFLVQFYPLMPLRAGWPTPLGSWFFPFPDEYFNSPVVLLEKYEEMKREAEKRMRVEIRLRPGCTIIGPVVGWFMPPTRKAEK